MFGFSLTDSIRVFINSIIVISYITFIKSIFISFFANRYIKINLENLVSLLLPRIDAGPL